MQMLRDILRKVYLKLAKELTIKYFDPRVGRVDIFLHSSLSRLPRGPFSLLYNDYRGLSPGIKTAERRTSHPTSS